MTGINFNSIAFYANQGIIIPLKDNPEGKGNKRLYTWENLVEVLLVKELLKVGITLKTIKMTFQSLRHSEQLRLWKEAGEKQEDWNLFESRTNAVFKSDLLLSKQIYYIMFGKERLGAYSYFSNKLPVDMNPKHDLLGGEELYSNLVVINMSYIANQIKSE